MATDLARLPKQTGQFNERSVETVSCDELRDPDAVWGRLEALGPCAGWYCTTGTLRVVAEAETLNRTADPPLSAELLTADGQSFHLRHRGDGCWRATVLQQGDSEGVLVRRVDMLVAGCRGLRATYEVAWAPVRDAAGCRVYRPTVSRFAGFVGSEEETS